LIGPDRSVKIDGAIAAARGEGFENYAQRLVTSLKDADLKPPNGKALARAEAEMRILGAAEEVFADAGFSGASMQQIATRAGMPKANLHYYFKSKERLYRRVIERILTTWLEAANAFSAEDDPAQALTAYIDAKMELSRKHPAGSKVWAAEIMRGAPVIQGHLEGELSEWLREREAAIGRWIERGLIRAVEPRNLVYMIWATTQHYADFGHQVRVLNGGDFSEADWMQAKRDVTRVVLGGLGLEA